MVIGPYNCKKKSGGRFIIHTVFDFVLFCISLLLKQHHHAACLFIDLPFKAPKLLCIAHNLSKVDVKHVSTVFQHDVVIVAVTDPQDERGHAPPCTRVEEVHHGLRIRKSKSEYSSLQSSKMVELSKILQRC